MIRRSRRVKIIATLGPASADRAVVANLFKAGADVFRINMSHASHEAMRERVAMIRSLEEEFDRPIGILVDLQGPKLRVGEFATGGVAIAQGRRLSRSTPIRSPATRRASICRIRKSSARSSPATAF